MNKILLANIGNSHIRYIGTTPEVQLKGDRNVPFRESTRFLLENFEVESENIIPEILPPLIDLELNSLKKIILFVTDSPSGERNNQDTIYIGEILKRIFSAKYYEVEVEVIPISLKVTDINALMQFYRDFVNNLLNHHENDLFILADAGGTSQQKTSLKIILEYLIEPLQFKAYNIKFDKGKSITEQIASDEYRRVLNQQQVAKLIQQYDYTGALVVNGVNWKKSTTPVTGLLLIAQALFSNDIDEGRRRALSFPKNFELKEYTNKIAEGVIYIKGIEYYNSLFSPDTVFALTNVLKIAKAHMQTQNWGFVILFHHIFLERFLQSIIEPLVQPQKLSDWPIIKERIEHQEIFEGIKDLGGRPIDETFSATIPILMSLAKHLNDTKINSVLSLLKMDYQKQFSGLRNKFAHEGRTIKECDVRFLLPVFNNWQELFFVKENSIFDELNRFVIMELKK